MTQTRARTWRSLLMLSLAVWVSLVQARDLAIWDLDTLVRTAVEQHPSVLNAQRLINAAQADEAYAERQRWPELTINSVAQSDQTTAAVVVRQPLWAGGAIEAGEEVSRAALAVSRATAQEQQLTIGLRVLEAWRNYALSAEQITIVDQGIEQLRELVAMIQRRVDARISPRVELDLAQARVIQAQITRASLVAERDLAVKRLQELVGAPIVTQAPPGQAPMARWLEAIRKPVSLPTGAEQEHVAREQPTVRRVREEATLAQREIRQIEALQWPSVYLQYQQGVNQALTNDKRLGLALEYTPGRGFSSRQQVQGAIARAQARDINVQTAIRDARDSLNAKLQEMSRSRALERSWVPSVSASEKLLASYQRQFIAGRKSWQDVLGQQNELTQARQSLVDARVRWLSAYAELQLLIASSGGGLPTADWLSAVAPSDLHDARGQSSLPHASEHVASSAASSRLAASSLTASDPTTLVGQGLEPRPASDASDEVSAGKPAAVEVRPLGSGPQAAATAAAPRLADAAARGEKRPIAPAVHAVPVTLMRGAGAAPLTPLGATLASAEVSSPAGRSDTATVKPVPMVAAWGPDASSVQGLERQASSLGSTRVDAPSSSGGVGREPVAVARAMAPAKVALEAPSSPGLQVTSQGAQQTHTRPASTRLSPEPMESGLGGAAAPQEREVPQVWSASALFVDERAESPRLSAAGTARLQAWAEAALAAADEPGALHVNAYSDALTTDGDDIKRAKTMAMAVSASLRRFGLRARQWRVRWHGLAQAVTASCTEGDATGQEACQQPNRRVEVRVDWAPVKTAQVKE